jgi:hypothetical protein
MTRQAVRRRRAVDEAPAACTLDVDRRRARLAAAVVAGAFDMAPEVFFRATRGAAAEAEARQIFNLVWLRMGADAGSAASVARLGKAIGRDRATLQHAVRKIEAACEGSADLDRMIATLADVGRTLDKVQAVTLAAVADAITAAREDEIDAFEG